MTPHKVECFNHNGEPYGRYVLPEGFEYSFLMIGWSSPSSFINANTFPMPGAEIGKTHEKEEVEIVSQINRGRTYGLENEDWQDTKKMNPSAFQLKNKEFRQIFRLIPHPVDHSKSSDSCNQAYLLSGNNKQRVEKEPDLTPEQYFEITGFHTPEERRAYEEGFEAKEKVMIEFIEKWDGSDNSGLGELLDRKFKEWSLNQP